MAGKVSVLLRKLGDIQSALIDMYAKDNFGVCISLITSLWRCGTIEYLFEIWFNV